MPAELCRFKFVLQISRISNPFAVYTRVAEARRLPFVQLSLFDPDNIFRSHNIKEMNRSEKVIGIVGGMGPQAGAALFNKILLHTPATSDQQHLSAILMSYPKYILDRTAFLEGSVSVNPGFSIVKVINKLEEAGAKVVGIACNTSHSPLIYDVIIEELSKVNSQIKLINMPHETCRYIKINHPQIKRIGLMTTNGLYKSGIYKNLLQYYGFVPVLPDFTFQNEVIHKMIYDPVFGIKSNPKNISAKVKTLIKKALHFFRNEQADAIILGCSELSLIQAEDEVKDMIVIDSLDILARALVREATQQEVTEEKHIFDILNG